MESTTPAAPVTDAQAAPMELAPPVGPADAKPPPAAEADAQPTEAKPPKLEISPRAWAERERDKEHDLDEVPTEVTAETVLECLRRCEVQENEDRKNVRTDEDVAVRSITLGALSRSHAPARPSGWTRRQPRLARLLAEFGDKILPEGFPFASIQLNYAYASAMHTDKSNDGPSAIIALGEFTGGELWTADRGVLPCRNELRLFNGNQPHCTLPFKGERYSLIYFSSSGHDRMAPKDVQQCEALGFCRLPTAPLSTSTPSTRRLDTKDAAPHVVAERVLEFFVRRRELRGAVDVGQRRRRQSTEPERFALLYIFGSHAIMSGRRKVNQRVPFTFER